ncbi:MAG TPA: lysozyme inhibitor LprI family protein [Edaphobacter sp.]|nr:lysozyme inhibitor LprI family protein [Edaphobacter sp.]
MITLVRSRLLLWLLLLAALLGYDSIARAQHFNSAGAPCRNVVVTQAMENCFDKAYRAADGELNQMYSQISKVLQPDELQQLKVAQRLWIQFRDATCTAESNLYAGGTASAPAYSACLEEETRKRVADLKTTYGWVITNSK